ncbi:MAG: hypothetical protein MUO78_02790 [candidate division Zixibacteria bacterium]|nr:hypothetical protein [candidate division Zixibacteria bacterium]
MKKKIILGLLVGVLFLFFTISVWALDYEGYLKAKHDGHPWQESDRIPVTPQTVDNYPTTIKFIFIPNMQNPSVLIYIEKTSSQAPIKTQEPVENSTITVKAQDER